MSEKLIEVLEREGHRGVGDSYPRLVETRLGNENDQDEAQEQILAFIRERTTLADADGVVVPMIGDLGSTVTAALAVEALGAANVYGLVLPCTKFGTANARDAEALAEALGIDYDIVHLQPLFTEFSAIVPEQLDLRDDLTVMSNLIARIRMTMTYLAANAMNRLVLGSTNRSERLLGDFTKHGDGGADLLPIGHLYETEVRILAETLDVPEFVVEQRPTPEYLPKDPDGNDLDASHEAIDAVLALAVKGDFDSTAIANRLNLREEMVAVLLTRYKSAAHKRARPPTPRS